MTIEQVFEEASGNGTSSIDKILVLTKRIQEIDRAIDTIKYNNELYTEVPEVVKKLASAKDAAVAELKTL